VSTLCRGGVAFVALRALGPSAQLASEPRQGVASRLGSRRRDASVRTERSEDRGPCAEATKLRLRVR